MDDNGEFILNNDCLLEIMKYIIADSELGDTYLKCRTSKCNDLINFLLAHEIFLELFKARYKHQYKRIALHIASTMTMLLIDLRVNKLLNKNKDFFWRYYLHDIREKMETFYIQLTFESSCVKIALKQSDTGSFMLENDILHLNEEITAEALVDICKFMSVNPKLISLDLRKAQVLGDFCDIAPHCRHLKKLEFRWNQKDLEYAPLEKLPNLDTFIIDGVQQSNSRSELFKAIRKWKGRKEMRPKDLQPLLLTLVDCYIMGPTLTFAAYESLESLRIYQENKNKYFRCKYMLGETSEDLSSLEECLITIPADKNTTISFDRDIGELRLCIPNNSDTSELVPLLKLPNLDRVIFLIKNESRWNYIDSRYSELRQKSVRNLVEPLVPLAWKSFIVKNKSLELSEAKDIATIKSIRYLCCNLSDWESMKLFDQLTNLQFASISVPSTCETPATGILSLLATCNTNAEIVCKDFNIGFRKKEQVLKIHMETDRKADVLVPLAQLNNIKSLEISGFPYPGSLNTLFEAFGTSNMNTIEELDIQSNRLNFKNIFKVTEIQSIKKLKLSLINPPSHMKWADFDKLMELSLNTGEERTLIGIFTELTSKNIIRCLKILCKTLSPEEVIQVSQIKSLQELECSISNTEDLESLTELANSPIENLKVFGLDANNSLRKLLSAFSSSSTTRLQHLKIEGKALNKKELLDISKIRNLRSLSAGFLHSKCLKLLNRLPHLENLVIDNFQQTRKNSLKFLPSTLRKLELNYSIGPSAFRHLAKLEMLESLKCSLPDDPAIKLLANIKVLKELNVSSAKGSLHKLFGAFAEKSLSMLQELHTPNLKESIEFQEISRIKSLVSLNISHDTCPSNMSVLCQLNELKSLRITDFSKQSMDNLDFVPIFQSCRKLDCVTIKISKEVAKKFVREVYLILKSIRDPLTQTPLQLHLFENTYFPSFYLEDIDEAYLKVFYTYIKRSL